MAVRKTQQLMEAQRRAQVESMPSQPPESYYSKQIGNKDFLSFILGPIRGNAEPPELKNVMLGVQEVVIPR